MMKPYPVYKDSGVPWIGEVPEEWALKRLKFATSINPGKGELTGLPETLEVSFYPMEAIGFGCLNQGETKTLDTVGSGFTYFRDDDVLIAKITPSFENGKGALATGLKNGIGFGSTEIHVIRPQSDIDKHFLYYITYSHPFREVGAGMMEGTAGQKRVPTDFLTDYLLALPSLPEQCAIAAYLDHKTAQIDALIANKRRRLDLLAEERTARISHAVTKGLDPDAPFKDSGIEWIGEIPARWNVVHLRFVSRSGLKNGLFKKGDEFGRGNRLVNVSDVYTDNFTVRENKLERVEANKSELQTYEVKTGDIFFVRSSLKREGIAKAACIDEVTEPTVFECHLIKITPNEDIVNYKFLTYFLNSTQIRDRLIALSITTTMTTISQAGLASLEILLPRLSEQRAIAAYLDEKTAQIDRVVAQTERQIALLQEYRTALISAAVTGKIDVRQEVAL